MSAEYIDEIDPLVQSVATTWSRRFRRWGVEQPDLAQDLWVWVIQHPKRVSTWLDEGKDGERQLAKTLHNEASRLSQITKSQLLGYEISDLRWYQRGELSVLLDLLWETDSWVSPPEQDGEKRRGGDPATGNNWLATLADVSRAFDQLKDADKDLLYLYHRDGKTNVDLARRRGVSEQAQSRMHHRALGRLLDLLGGEKPRSTHDQTDCECGGEYVGTRRAVSNAAARAVTENYYQED